MMEGYSQRLKLTERGRYKILPSNLWQTQLMAIAANQKDGECI
uniref:Uncharacterized protein n=1 Tax=Picea glauca TaxID=3330 RepID=A0A101M289_PICGL|nr:hypothetical protein ABT39_MTgene2886 [Picea glauca]